MYLFPALARWPFLRRIFLSPEETRLRAGWRLLLQTLLLLLLISAVDALFGLLSQLLGPVVMQPFLWGQVAELLVITGSVYVARRWLDQRSFESLGLKLDGRTLPDILVGIAITFVQMSFIYLIMLLLGWLTFTGFAWEVDPVSAVLTGFLTFLIDFILVGWNEELLSRGYHLQTIASGTNLFWGVVFSSAIFALLHLFNPGANLGSTLGIFLTGIYLAYGYLRTKQLWLSIGLHIGWNFFEGVVFGFPVSGLSEIYKLIRIQVHGPELWTGGAFGPEAGLVVLPALALGAVLIYVCTGRRAM